jgi:hypothetical protein
MAKQGVPATPGTWGGATRQARDYRRLCDVIKREPQSPNVLTRTAEQKRAKELHI